MNDEYRNLVSDCEKQGRALGQQLTNQGIMPQLYLYCRPSEPGKGPGQLVLIQDDAPVPEGLMLVTGEGLRCNVAFSRYWQWIYERGLRAHILSIP